MFFTVLSHAQALNDYKYVIVDNQYEFQNVANEYRLNEMMVFEINKRGLEAFTNTSVLPKNLNVGTCNALGLKVITSKGLRIKMLFEFVNCDGETVFTTKEGIGRTKDFEKAYREAVRDAMSSLDEFNYVYKKPAAIEPQTILSQPINPSPDVPAQVLSGTPSHAGSKEKKDELKVDVSPEPEFVELVIDDTYLTHSKEYKIQSVDLGFNIYKNNSLIGTLKKSQSGCYLVVTTEFIGIGYEKDSDIIIEYDKNGTQFLVFKKAE